MNTTVTESLSPNRASAFFLVMALVVAVVVVYGFSFTIRENLLAPSYPRPVILYVHAFAFASWVALFIAQATLVRIRRTRLHRSLGRWGIVLGCVIPPLGVATAIVMVRLRVAHGETGVAAGFPVPIFDMLAFAATFGLAALWRARPQFHRRLMFMATAVLTAAAFGRMPIISQEAWFYAGVDALVLAGAVRDFVTDGRVHVVYRIGLPALAAGQLLTVWVCSNEAWVAAAPGLFD